MFARILLAALACVAAPSAAHAGWTISIGNASVDAGQKTTVDVFVTGGSEYLDYFYAQFRIEMAGGGAADGLRFTNPQPVGFTADPGYVFFGNSGGPLSPSVSSLGGATNDTLIVGDLTADGLGVDVSMQPRLLARLEVTADPKLSGTTTFRIRLVADASDFQQPIDPDADSNSRAFSSTDGSVTVLGGDLPAPVPEPGTLLALATGAPVLAGWAWARRRRSGAATHS